MNPGLDAKHFVHLPRWAKALCLGTLALALLAALAVVARSLGTGDQDWLLIGISGVQFLATTFVIAVVLFVSQTDANIATLRARAEQFLIDTLPAALARITLADPQAPPLTVSRGVHSDIFGYDYAIEQGGVPLLRFWCGVNVGRMIVIYRFADPEPTLPIGDFAERVQRVFHFSLGGAAAVGYKPSFEPLPGSAGAVSMLRTVVTQPDFLTDPAVKLFWSQDVAMMTESILRTGLRHEGEVRLDVASRPHPL